jgi:hypothetical protein
MLDVHPPHESAHTWKDFFLHIATIVVGLIIAVGLEQGVEAIHAHHQLHQLRVDLQVESEVNQNRGVINLQHIDLDMAWLQELHNRIEALRTGADRKSFVYPPLPDGYPGDPRSTDRRLVLVSVWNNARQAAILGLLPRDEGQFYNRFYAITQFTSDSFDKLTTEWEKIPAIEFPFRKGGPTGRLEIERMSDAQLDAYAAAVAEVYMSAQFNKRLLQIQQAWNDEAVGQRTEPAIGQYLKSHVDPLPPYDPSRFPVF